MQEKEKKKKKELSPINIMIIFWGKVGRGRGHNRILSLVEFFVVVVCLFFVSQMVMNPDIKIQLIINQKRTRG